MISTYASLVMDVKHMKIKKESTRDYWLVEHYDTIIINGAKNLIFPISEKEPKYKNVSYG